MSHIDKKRAFTVVKPEKKSVKRLIVQQLDTTDIWATNGFAAYRLRDNDAIWMLAMREADAADRGLAIQAELPGMSEASGPDIEALIKTARQDGVRARPTPLKRRMNGNLTARMFADDVAQLVWAANDELLAPVNNVDDLEWVGIGAYTDKAVLVAIADDLPVALVACVTISGSTVAAVHAWLTAADADELDVAS